MNFEDLPYYVNTCSVSDLEHDIQYNGKESEVTYYIKEIVDGQTTAVYECADKNDSKKSDENKVEIYGKKGDTTFTAENGVITVPKSDSYNGVLSVLIEGLPKNDIYGNKYTYSTANRRFISRFCVKSELTVQMKPF